MHKIGLKIGYNKLCGKIGWKNLEDNSFGKLCVKNVVKMGEKIRVEPLCEKFKGELGGQICWKIG